MISCTYDAETLRDSINRRQTILQRYNMLQHKHVNWLDVYITETVIQTSTSNKTKIQC